MSQPRRFPHLEDTARLLDSQGGQLTQDELRELLCRDCDFFREDHEEELECAGFRILRSLLVNRVMTPDSLARALGDGKPEQAWLRP